MRDELYINGVKADLLENHINLNYSSNLLTDVGKIVSNNSYTIKLPKTSGNLFFIQCAHIPSSESKFPYLKHAARLVRDGVEMISDANVVLLAVNDYIEIALTWGNVNNFAPVADKSLREINYNLDDYVKWEKHETFNRQFPKISYGFRENETEVWYHPAVSVKWIMEKIAVGAGVHFDLPSDRLQELEELFIPLIDRNDSDLLGRENAITLIPYSIIQTNFFKVFSFNRKIWGDYYFTMIDEHKLKVKNHVTKVKLSGGIAFVVNVNGNNGDPNSANLKVEMQVRNLHDNGTPVLTTVPAIVTHIEGKIWEYKFNFENVEFEVQPNDEVGFTLVDIYTIGTDVYTISIVSGEAGSMYLIGSYEIKLGDRYYTVPNLPDIKQIDFIKSISNMLGLFAVPTSQNEIKFVSFDELSRNMSKAPDWTKLIMHRTIDSLPQNTEYALDDMARLNHFKYKESKDGMNDEGIIKVDNLTIEYERDAVELPFEATRTKDSIAYIPLYTYDNDKLKTESVNPRILRYVGSSGTFNGLTWNTLLEKYYKTYTNIVTNAKVITEEVKLNSVQLKNTDLTVPVYLAQYGSYFAIINIKTKDDNICEVKLLKM